MFAFNFFVFMHSRNDYSYHVFILPCMYCCTGIVAASILGYILPVAIYLKTYEAQVRRKLVTLGLVEQNSGASQGRDSGRDVDTTEQRDFDKNIALFVVLGVFGVCSLLIGLVVELMGMFTVTQGGDSTAMY